MNEEIKSIIDELIDYRKNRKPIRFLNKVFNEIGDQEIVQPIGWLLLWHKEYFLGLKSANRYDISDILYNKYLKIFELCEELKHVFSLHKTHIGWAANLTEQQQNEIREYIQDNYVVQVRIRRKK